MFYPLGPGELTAKAFVPYTGNTCSISLAVLVNGVITDSSLSVTIGSGQMGVIPFVGGPLPIGPNDSAAFHTTGQCAVNVALAVD